MSAPLPQPPENDTVDGAPLARIQEVAEQTGLTPRAIRYYEEVGLLEPAARSDGSYRLYDRDDLERLSFIKGLREDAGFSLAEIRQLLEDEAARAQLRARYAATADPAERREILLDAIARVDRQVGSLRSKIERLSSMVDEALARRGRLEARLDAPLETAASKGEGAAPDPKRAGT